MAIGNVVLQIGSQLGPGGLASLKAGIDMVSQFSGAIVDTIAECEKFSKAMQNIDMDIVNFADSAAKGQVDTLAEMQALNKLRIAGIEPTKEQFAAMTKAAAEMQQNGLTDATTAFNMLTESITKGTSEGLIPYGIQLETTTDKSKAQKNALSALEKKYSDVDIKLHGVGDRVYALKNNWGTLTGVIYDAITQGDGPLASMLDSVNDSLGDISGKIISLPKDTKSYIFSIQSIADNLKITFGEIKKSIWGLFNWDTSDIDKEIEDSLERVRGAYTGKMVDQSMGGDEGKENQKKKTAVTPKTPGAGAGTSKEIDWEATDADAQAQSDKILENLLLGAGKVTGAAAANAIDVYLGLVEESIPKTAEMIFGVQEAQTAANAEARKGMDENDEYNRKVYEKAADNIDRLIQKQLQYWEIVHISADQAMEEQEARDAEVWLAKMRQIEEEKKAQREFLETTEGKTQQVANTTDKLSNAWSTVKGTTEDVLDAYEKGTSGMTKAQALFYYIDSTIAIVSDSAHMAEQIAGHHYWEAAQYAIAIAGHIACVALASAYSGGGGGRSSATATSATATASSYSGGYDSGNDINSVEVVLTMDDASKAMGWIIEQNSRNARSGGRYLQEGN